MIPFNVPYVPAVSKEYVKEVLQGTHLHGDGPFTYRCSQLISNLVGGGKVLLTPSCTHALEMASMLADIGPGDEVILPAYTFTSAAIAVTKFGAKPVFVDIEMETKGIDVDKVKHAISPRTKAISWVNYAGVAPNIEGLIKLAERYNLILIEDNAHGLGGEYKGKPLGSFGDFATQSFHATKNIQCGEGGALIINNPKFIERAEIIREKGTNRKKFVSGEIKKYQWVDKGSSYLLAETLSAILCGQLEQFQIIQNSRLLLWKEYWKNLHYLESNLEFVLQTKNSLEEKNLAHMFYLNLDNEFHRDKLKNQLVKMGIKAASHYETLNTSIEGLKLSNHYKTTPNALNFSRTILRLPMYIGLTTDEIKIVTDCIISNVIR